MPDLVVTLLDLTFYDHKELVSKAIELVVRHFQQRAVLHRFGQQVQLLVKPEIVKHYATFDTLVGKLQRLAARRRLFEHERYAATRLLGLLTMYCYEENATSSAISVGTRRTAAAATVKTDHTAGLYILLVGRAKVTPALARRGSRISSPQDSQLELENGPCFLVQSLTRETRTLSRRSPHPATQRRPSARMKSKSRIATRTATATRRHCARTTRCSSKVPSTRSRQRARTGSS